VREELTTDGGPGSTAVGRRYTARVIGTGAVALALTAPGQTAAISAFVDPLIGGLHLSRTAVSTAYMVGTLGGACAMPALGRAIDRFGARRTMIAIALAFGAVLMSLSAVGGILGLTAGFIGIRMLGQGALNLTATTTVAIYISRRRGLAQGVTSAVGSAGICLAPVLLESLVADHGFRRIWFCEGLVIWAIVIPLALFMLPRRPRTMRAAHDEESGRADRSKELPPVDWTLRQAMRTGMFWVIASSVAVVSLLSTALAFHQIDVLGERGLSPAQAAADFVPQTIAGLAATLLAGYLADRLSDRTLIIGSMAVLIIALIAAGYAAPGWSALGYGMALGVAGNGFRTLEATVFPSCFGLAHIGAIRGVVHTLTVAGSAFGPVLLSLGHNVAGSYRPVVLALTVMPVAAIVAAAFVRRPPAVPPGTPWTAPPAAEQITDEPTLTSE
jgi:MFS family permease